MSDEKQREALVEIAEICEEHFLFNPEIFDETMKGNHDLAIKIGGDEATFSELAAIARKALQ